MHGDETGMYVPFLRLADHLLSKYETWDEDAKIITNNFFIRVLRLYLASALAKIDVDSANAKFASVDGVLFNKFISFR